MIQFLLLRFTLSYPSYKSFHFIILLLNLLLSADAVERLTDKGLEIFLFTTCLFGEALSLFCLQAHPIIYIIFFIIIIYVNYPQTKDLRASDFIADCPWEGLASAPSV